MSKAKFKIGQKVWYMCCDSTCEEEVSAIMVCGSVIWYRTGDIEANEEFRPYNGMSQNQLFATKADLLKSL